MRAQKFPKSVLEASRGNQIQFREHLEQQVGLPWPIWAAIGTLGGPIWAFLGLNLELRGFICWPDGAFWVPRASILRVPARPEAIFFWIQQQICFDIHELIWKWIVLWDQNAMGTSTNNGSEYLRRRVPMEFDYFGAVQNWKLVQMG